MAPGIDGLVPHGFAADTAGGAGGRVVVVTSDQDDPSRPLPGTLRQAVSLPGPKWIVFATDMTIRLGAPLRVTSDTTIDGRGHRVMLTGHDRAGLQIYDVHDVVIEDLDLRDFGDVAKTILNDPDDAIDIQRSSRVWIDHCAISHAADKGIAVEDGGDQITISWNHFYDQEQTLQLGSLSTATRDTAINVTIDHNYFDRVGYRTPVVSYGKAHVYNNYIDQWSVSAVRSERLAQVFLEGNIFRAGASRRASTVSVAQTCNDKKTLCDGRPGYLAETDNMYIGKVLTQSTGPAHVFNPAFAYGSLAEKSSLQLSQRIAAFAGPREGARVLAPTPIQSPKVLTPLRPENVSVALRGRNARRGADVLTVGARGLSGSRPVVTVSRRVHARWVPIKRARPSRSGSMTVLVRDRSRRSMSTYRATVATAAHRVVGSNMVRLR